MSYLPPFQDNGVYSFSRNNYQNGTLFAIEKGHLRVQRIRNQIYLWRIVKYNDLQLQKVTKIKDVLIFTEAVSGDVNCGATADSGSTRVFFLDKAKSVPGSSFYFNGYGKLERTKGQLNTNLTWILNGNRYEIKGSIDNHQGYTADSVFRFEYKVSRRSCAGLFTCPCDQ